MLAGPATGYRRPEVPDLSFSLENLDGDAGKENAILQAIILMPSCGTHWPNLMRCSPFIDVVVFGSAGSQHPSFSFVETGTSALRTQGTGGGGIDAQREIRGPVDEGQRAKFVPC